MCRLSALSRSLLRTLWRSGRALERELEGAACAHESPAVARIALTKVYYQGLLQPICAVPGPWSLQFSNIFMCPCCDAQIKSKILRLESEGKNCAHHLVHLLGKRLVIERRGLGDLTDSEHELQDVGFSVIRDIKSRSLLLSQINTLTQRQSIQTSDHDPLSVKTADRQYLKGEQM